jgi:hypothetical protein
VSNTISDFKIEYLAMSGVGAIQAIRVASPIRIYDFCYCRTPRIRTGARLDLALINILPIIRLPSSVSLGLLSNLAGYKIGSLLFLFGSFPQKQGTISRCDWRVTILNYKVTYLLLSWNDASFERIAW